MQNSFQHLCTTQENTLKPVQGIVRKEKQLKSQPIDNQCFFFHNLQKRKQKETKRPERSERPDTSEKTKEKIGKHDIEEILM